MNKDLELFMEIEEHLMKDDKPSLFLNKILRENRLSEAPFSMLSDLINTDQNTKYHPEGAVWNHVMMVVDEAATRREESENPRAFMWAALLHDIGKAPTTRIRKGKITSYNHEKVGHDMALEFLRSFTEDEELIEGVSSLVRWHMEPLFAAKNLPFANIKQMLRETSLDEIALLSTCDRLGRGDMSSEKAEDEKKGIENFVEKCIKVKEEMKK